MKSHPWSFLLGIAVITFVGGWLAGQSQAQQAQRPMVYELRTYTTVEGRLPALHARFRDHTMKLFARHGMKNVLYTTPLTGENKENKLVYLLAHESQESAEKSFAAFRSDPEWTKARDDSEKDGKIVAKVESVFLAPTDYSPTK